MGQQAGSGKKAVFFLLLVLAGMAGNTFGIPIAGGLVFISGSIAVMIVIRTYGGVLGTAAAFAVGTATLFAWHQPYLMVLTFLEGLTVSLFLNWKDNLRMADLLFWVFLGFPVEMIVRVYFLGGDFSSTVLFSLVRVLNGLANTWLATLLTTYVPRLYFSRVKPSRQTLTTVSLNQLLFDLLITFFLGPALTLMYFQGYENLKNIENNIRIQTFDHARELTASIGKWKQTHFDLLAGLAREAAQTTMTPEPVLQQAAEKIRGDFPEYMHIHVDNEAGVSIAFAPYRDEQGLPAIGRSFADRQFYRDIKASKGPVMTETMYAKVRTQMPIMALGVPVLKDGKYRGEVIGTLELSYLKSLLEQSSAIAGVKEAILVDGRGLVIGSTGDRPIMEKLSGLPDNRLTALDILGSNQQMFGRNEKNPHENYALTIPLGGNMSWSLVILVSLAPYRDLLFGFYLRNIPIISGLIALAVLVANLASRRLARPLAYLAWLTTNLPNKLEEGQEISWPRPMVTELNSLAQNIWSMAETLRLNFVRLQEEKNKLAATVAGIGDGISIQNLDYVITYQNEVMKDLVGEHIGERCYQAYVGREGQCNNCMVAEAFKDGDVHSDERLMYTKKGRLPVEITVSPLRDSEGKLVSAIEVIRDVSQRKQAEEKLLYQAYHDPLTGLPNRILFNKRLQQALEDAREWETGVALMFLDLDRFKLVNDSLGHEVGDCLLKEVAQRLNELTGGERTIARMGGDEFCLLCPGLFRTDTVSAVAANVLSVFRTPWLLMGHEFHITASLGIALYPVDGEDGETLLKHADTAMYQAKQEGRNTFSWFTLEMNTAILEKIMMENCLRHALERGELEVFYQPLVDTLNYKFTGAEALLRWNSPELGQVPPVSFIPLAEDLGLINAFGEWVLRTACTQAQAWQTIQGPPLRVTVNVSVRQIQISGFPELVAKVLKETGLSPERLELEITESVFMEDAQHTVRILEALRDIGIRIAVDDFGTGFSSLGYLKRFPVNTLKIDRSFIQDLPAAADQAIVSAIIVLANKLNLNIVAEGVETPGQLVCLNALGCHEVQGYLFAPALPAEEAEELLKGFPR